MIIKWTSEAYDYMLKWGRTYKMEWEESELLIFLIQYSPKKLMMCLREASYMFSSSSNLLRILSIFTVPISDIDSSEKNIRKSIEFSRKIFSRSIFLCFSGGGGYMIFLYMFLHMFISWHCSHLFNLFHMFKTLQLLPKWLCSLLSLTSYE